MLENRDQGPFSILWKIATCCLAVALVSSVIAIVLRILLFIVPEGWSFWHGLLKILHTLFFWAFAISLPVMIVLSIIAFIGTLIWRVTRKEEET